MSIRNPTIGEWTDSVMRSANRFASRPTDPTRASEYEFNVRRLVEVCIEKRIETLRHERKSK